jgi:hypothetical protein
MKKHKQIAIDFDKTLHFYEGRQHFWDLQKPIPKMLERVKTWLKEGHKVSIFTARVAHDESTNSKQTKLVQDWLELHDLPRLPVTATKFSYFDEFWDDKAISVNKNEGSATAYKDGEIVGWY